MKLRIKSEDGLELSTVCRQLKLKAADGKMRVTDVTDTETLLRIIQSKTGKSVVTGENFLPPAKEKKKIE